MAWVRLLKEASACKKGLQFNFKEWRAYALCHPPIIYPKGFMRVIVDCGITQKDTQPSQTCPTVSSFLLFVNVSVQLGSIL
jgi:hypothetical protein